ncbi:MAG: NTP transferase domain-containing protein, partial [Candidatus Fermentibacteraceae bacterium]|nr:NTP transferase domain-containing protein [Candidatus Fermentibacteraceae bacterium]
MRSPLPKVVHPVLGVPMVIRVVHQAIKAGFDEPVVVVGHGRDGVIPLLENEDIPWAVQEEQLGTAHALMQVRDLLKDRFIVMNGDDLYCCNDMNNCIKQFDEHDACVLAQPVDEPERFGVYVTENGLVKEIVEKPK